MALRRSSAPPSCLTRLVLDERLWLVGTRPYLQSKWNTSLQDSFGSQAAFTRENNLPSVTVFGGFFDCIDIKTLVCIHREGHNTTTTVPACLHAGGGRRGAYDRSLFAMRTHTPTHRFQICPHIPCFDKLRDWDVVVRVFQFTTLLGDVMIIAMQGLGLVKSQGK